MNKTITLLAILFCMNLSAQCWEKLSAGNSHTAGIKTDGTLWVWGGNTFGQLGDGTFVRKNTPKQVGAANNWVEVTAGYNQTFAIKSDGTLWGWGDNEFYQLGDGTTTIRNVPTQIGTATNWVKVAVGFNHAIAKKSNGTIWGWGANISGEVGTGSQQPHPTPIQIGTATNWKTIECGQGHTLATKTNGTLWAWGINGYGRLGDGTTTDRETPVQIGTATNWVDAAGGNYHSIGLKSDGSIWCWGYDSTGQIGDGTPSVNRLTPVRVGADNMWNEIAAGASHTLAIGVSGDLWAWGSNSASQLTGALDEYAPYRVGFSQYWKKVAAGAGHTVAITEPIVLENGEWVTQLGVLKVFGGNSSGQLGDGTYTRRDVVTTIACPTSVVLANEDFESQDAASVYPNPVRDVLNVSSESKINQVTVYDVLGQQVLRQDIGSREAGIDVSGLEAGTYFIRIDATQQRTLKIIKL